jgi:hypothetical protein
MWFKNYFNELKAWSVMRRVYKENKPDFEKVGLKCDWFGRLWKVINRDVSIALGSSEDEALLRDEMEEIRKVLVKTNVIDLLAYELIPLEERDDSDNTFENSYLIKLTPAWNLEKQYVTTKSTITLILTILILIGGITYSIIKWLI